LSFGRARDARRLEGRVQRQRIDARSIAQLGSLPIEILYGEQVVAHRAWADPRLSIAGGTTAQPNAQAIDSARVDVGEAAQPLDRHPPDQRAQNQAFI
jgi:hypothetical protein